MDWGANEHMSNRREWFSSYKKFDTVENIKIGDGKYIQVIESGSFLQEKSMRSSTCSNRRNTKMIVFAS